MKCRRISTAPRRAAGVRRSDESPIDEGDAAVRHGHVGTVLGPACSTSRHSAPSSSAQGALRSLLNGGHAEEALARARRTLAAGVGGEDEGALHHLAALSLTALQRHGEAAPHYARAIDESVRSLLAELSLPHVQPQPRSEA
jgi:hypothetical protein